MPTQAPNMLQAVISESLTTELVSRVPMKPVDRDTFWRARCKVDSPFLYRNLVSGARCFLTGDGTAGIAIYPDGEGCHLFSMKRKRGMAQALIAFAVAQGATYGRTFDGAIARLYRRAGLVEVARSPFDPMLAPRDWDYKRFGTPDIVTMKWRVMASPDTGPSGMADG